MSAFLYLGFFVILVKLLCGDEFPMWLRISAGLLLLPVTSMTVRAFLDAFLPGNLMMAELHSVIIGITCIARAEESRIAEDKADVSI